MNLTTEQKYAILWHLVGDKTHTQFDDFIVLISYLEKRITDVEVSSKITFSQSKWWSQIFKWKHETASEDVSEILKSKHSEFIEHFNNVLSNWVHFICKTKSRKDWLDS